MIPPVPFWIRSAMATPLLVISSICLALVPLLTPEVRDGRE